MAIIRNDIYGNFFVNATSTSGGLDEYTNSGVTGPLLKSYSNGVVQTSGIFDEVTNNPSTFGSLYFSGSSYLQTSSYVIPANGIFSVQLWVYPTSFNGTYGSTFFSQTNNVGSDTKRIAVGIANTSNPNVYIQYGSNINYGNTQLVLNQWNYVVLTSNGSASNVYVNNVLSYSNTSLGLIPNITNGVFVIGDDWNHTNYQFIGYISNFKISSTSNSAITVPVQPYTSDANTILLLQTPYTGDAFLDSSPNQYVITNNGSVTSSNNSPLYPSGYYSYYFNGNTLLYTSTSNTSSLVLGTNNYTIEFWINPISNTTYQTWIWQNSNTTTTPATGVLSVRWGGATGNNTLYLYGGTSGGITLASANITSNTNVWTHVAFVRNGSANNNTLMFVNGTLVSNSSVADASNYNYGFFTLGGARTSNFFTGYISNFRILNGTAFYTSNFTPPITPLTAISNTMILTAQSNRLSDNSSQNLSFAGSRNFNTVSNNNPFPAGFPFSYVSSGIPVSKTYANGTIQIGNIFDEYSFNGTINASTLVVAGGGGGGNTTNGTANSGGGGAGGVVANTNISLNTNTIYTIAVGKGGTGANANFSIGNGSNSSITGGNISIIAIGGGGGAGFAGGSGGGGGCGGAALQPTSASGGYGYPGIKSSCITSTAGGGGGAGSSGICNAGGVGIINPIGGSKIGQLVCGSYWIGGGGAGYNSLGGKGGGGNPGSTGGAASNGQINTGGGGGANYPCSSNGDTTTVCGAFGGSGVVVISYPGQPMFIGGKISVTPGGNTIHTFTCSPGSVLYPTTATNIYNAQLLVVGGGGGGGGGYSNGIITGAGGGAGGFICTNITLGVGNTVTIVVGSGGLGGANVTSGANGTNSSVSGVLCSGGSYIALGGGGGGSATTTKYLVGFAGGSGGGSANLSNRAAVSTQITLGYGNGNIGGYSQTNCYGGGGGGAGGPATGSGTYHANGGIGLSSSIIGSSVIYAAGGGGGSKSTPVPPGGSGIGGNGGSNTTVATNATGYGSGGGGGGPNKSPSPNGGNGSNGIVIIAYSGSQRFTGGKITTAGGNTIHTFTSNATITV